MIHETAHYTVPRNTVPACRQAIRELVEQVKEEEPETVLYTVLEDIGDERASFLHLAAFENVDARDRHHQSERLQLFVNLVYPATRDGIHFSEQKIVDRLPERLARAYSSSQHGAAGPL